MVCGQPAVARHVSGVFRAAVIPTRNRHDMVADCINSVVDQVDRVIVLDNLSTPPIDPEPWHGKVATVRVPLDPPNISQLWNIGLVLADTGAHRAEADYWDIAVLKSDVLVPPGWIERLSQPMRPHTSAHTTPYPQRVRKTRGGGKKG